MRCQDESLGDRVVEESEKRVVVAGDIENTAALVVDPKLNPGYDLAELFPRAEAPGKGDEKVREVGHRLLPLVHGVDDAQFRDTGMADLAGQKRGRYHADYLSPADMAAFATAPINPTRPPP